MADGILKAKGGFDVSDINNLEELRQKIELLKSSIKNDESLLEERFISLPKHLTKSVSRQVLPAFLNSLISSGAWNIFLSSISLFANPFAKGFSFKKNIVSVAKKLGMAAILKSAINLWVRKQSAKKQTSLVKKATMGSSAVS